MNLAHAVPTRSLGAATVRRPGHADRTDVAHNGKSGGRLGHLRYSDEHGWCSKRPGPACSLTRAVAFRKTAAKTPVRVKRKRPKVVGTNGHKRRSDGRGRVKRHEVATAAKRSTTGLPADSSAWIRTRDLTIM